MFLFLDLWTEGPGVTLKFTPPSDQLVLSVVLRLPRSPSANASITTTLEIRDKRSEVFHIHYIRSSTLLYAEVSILNYAFISRKPTSIN